MSWNHALQSRHVNYLVLVDIPMAQCIVTTQYELGFSIRNSTVTKICNNLQTKNLEFVIHFVIEGLRVDSGLTLVEAIALWKNLKKFKWLYSQPKKYLPRHVEVKFKVVDLDSSLDV